MEPTTIFLATSGIALLSGGLLYIRQRQKNKRLIREAKVRAEKRNSARKEANPDPYQEYDPFDSDTYGIAVSFKGKAAHLDKKENNIIDAIFEDHLGAIKHRPVFLTGKSVNDAASVPLKNSAFDELNHTDDMSAGVEVSFIDADFNWKERYDKKEVKIAPRAETEYVSPNFKWPEGYKAKVNA